MRFALALGPVLAITAHGVAEPQVAPAAPPAAVSVLLTATDPLDRARLVARLGDRVVLAALVLAAPTSEATPAPAGQPSAIVLALAAVRATPWLADPAAALGPLCALAAGRDPDLAPAASYAIAAIARRLAEEPNLREDFSDPQIAGVIEQLQAIAQRPRVRPDLQLTAQQASAQLEVVRLRMQE